MNSPSRNANKGKRIGDEELIFRRQPEGKGGRKKGSLEEPKKSKTQKETECNRNLLTFALIHQALADSSVILLLSFTPPPGS